MEAKEVLSKIASYGKELVAHPEYKPEQMAANCQYIRIGGAGFRAVSLDPKTPLSGYSDKPSNNLDTIFREFKELKPEPMKVEPEKKEERCLQRHIIKSALENGRNLLVTLDCKNSHYDELLFVTDEVSLGKVRCDLLALGKIGSNYYPVSIELKCRRDKKELLRQLEAFCVEIRKYGGLFSEIITTLTKRTDIKIDTENPHKMIVWPLADSEARTTGHISPKAKDTRKEIWDNNVHLIEYSDFKNTEESVIFCEQWAELCR